MPSEKSPGLKILWVWTLGTAASTLSFSYIIYSRSYTHTHTYLSFFFFLQYLLRVWCGQDWGTWRLSWTDNNNNNNNRNPFPLMCFWRTRCRGLRMLCEKKYHRFRSNTPPFIFVYLLEFKVLFVLHWVLEGLEKYAHYMFAECSKWKCKIPFWVCLFSYVFLTHNWLH